MKFLYAFAIILLTALAPGTAISDRVDCTVAENETEVLICDDAELLELDTLLEEEWQRKPRLDAELRRQQQWEGELIGLDAHQIRTLYRWRLVELKFGCVIDLSVSEITDDVYPAEELGEIIAEADRYFECMVGVISDPNLTASEFASFYRGVLYTLDWFPDAFMYPISELLGYRIYASFADETSRLNEALLDYVYQLAVSAHLDDRSISEGIVENQNEWRRYNERTCTAPIYTSISTYNGNLGGRYRCTSIGVEARILQLSAWIGGFEDYGYPDRSIDEVLDRLVRPLP